MFSVLIMEQDPMVSSIIEEYLAHIPDFQIAGTVNSLKEAGDFQEPFDLILAELNFPDGEFIPWFQEYSKEGLNVDFIPITAARQYEVYMQCVRLGAIDYILKPFVQERLRQALLRYKEWREKIAPDKMLDQKMLDRFYLSWDKGHNADRNENRISGNPHTKERIESFVQGLNGEIFTMEELSSALGMSRGTIRRYLDQMNQEGKLAVETSYGRVGRPINYYREKFQ